MLVVRGLAVAAVLGSLVVLPGCTGGEAADDGSPSGAASNPSPSLGGDRDPRVRPPRSRMDDLEQPVADLLADRLRSHGLELDHLDCPPWGGRTPKTLTCTGYLEGITGEIQVDLSRREDGSVAFEARLSGGVIATATLVRRLEAEGYTDVDCGERAAYRAEPGRRLVCRVAKGGVIKHVVATVRDAAGSVEIEDY